MFTNNFSTVAKVYLGCDCGHILEYPQREDPLQSRQKTVVSKKTIKMKTDTPKESILIVFAQNKRLIKQKECYYPMPTVFTFSNTLNKGSLFEIFYKHSDIQSRQTYPAVSFL